MSAFTDPTRQTARKTHGCCTCNRAIRPGESYLRQRGYDGGDAWTFKQCQHCDAVWSIWAPESIDGGIQWDGYDDWASYPGKTITETRAIAGWQRQWRTQSGKLWPIPSLTAVTP